MKERTKNAIFYIICVSFLMGSILLLCTGCLPRKVHSSYSDYVNDIRESYAVNDVDNRLYNMQWFQEQYYALEAQIASYESETDATIKSSMKMIINREIGKYNAASNTYYREMWKDNGLPAKIELLK
jgi:Tfp pilus assembly protein PilE